MTPRYATIEDYEDLAHLHVQTWEETYRGRLPQSVFDNHNLERRLQMWRQILTKNMTVSYLPGIGFAQVGPNRRDDVRADYPVEMYTLYTLQNAHGSGAAQALMRHAIGSREQPMTAEVLKGNDRALRFYEKTGAQKLCELTEDIDGMDCTHLLLGWTVPIQLEN